MAKGKNRINKSKAFNILEHGYSLKVRELNYFTVRLTHEEHRNVFVDWFHTTGTLVMTDKGRITKLGHYTDPEEVGILVSDKITNRSTLNNMRGVKSYHEVKILAPRQPKEVTVKCFMCDKPVLPQNGYFRTQLWGNKICHVPCQPKFYYDNKPFKENEGETTTEETPRSAD